MKHNPHIGSNVLEFLETTIPDTPEMQRIEQQELFRFNLTQTMRHLREQAGFTQAEVAAKLGLELDEIVQLESMNHPHPLEAILTYIQALGLDLDLSILHNGQPIAKLATACQQTRAEVG